MQTTSDPGVARAVELAEEFGMNAVLVRPRLDLPEPLAAALLEEARLELAEVLLSGDWPTWHVEVAADHVVMVADGATRSMKRALVELEDAHPIGSLWNLDLVTLTDEGVRVWHHGPDRPTPRPPLAGGAARLLDGYEWSSDNAPAAAARSILSR